MRSGVMSIVSKGCALKMGLLHDGVNSIASWNTLYVFGNVPSLRFWIKPERLAHSLTYFLSNTSGYKAWILDAWSEKWKWWYEFKATGWRQLRFWVESSRYSRNSWIAVVCFWAQIWNTNVASHKRVIHARNNGNLRMPNISTQKSVCSSRIFPSGLKGI